MKYNFPKTDLWRHIALHFLHISLLSGLKDSWILLSALVFSLSWCIVLAEMYEENQASYGCVEKGGVF